MSGEIVFIILTGGRGVNKSNAVDCDGLWLLHGRSSLDMRHRLPGLSAGLAASLRSMPTAALEVVKSSSTYMDKLCLFNGMKKTRNNYDNFHPSSPLKYHISSVQQWRSSSGKACLINLLNS
jgi:hypothetical protein